MVIIDGTNLLWTIRDAGEALQVTNEEELCQMLDGYLITSGQDGVIVFDGAGPADRTAFAALHRLDVVFAGFNRDADTVIEGKVLTDSAPKRLIIVSSDHRLRDQAADHKAAVLRSEEFWEKVQTHRRSKLKRKEPSQKREGLTDGETDKWMDLFGLGE